MSAQVTEAHRELARRIMFEFTQAGTATASDVRMAAQIIADSEAKAVGPHAHVAAQLAAVLTECGAPEFANSEHALQWAKGIAQLRAEAERLKEAHHLADGTANLALVHRDAAEARAERAEAALRPLVGAVESVICDTEGAVAHIFEREPGDKWRVQVALDRARQACATIPTTKGDK